MPYYRRVGEVPAARHIAFTTSSGENCFEEFIGEEGFSGTGSLLYHLGVPSNLVDMREWDLGDLRTRTNHPLGPRHLKLPALFPPGSEKGADAVRGRVLVLSNADVRICYAVSDAESPLYSNGIGDEVVYIESGSARLESVFGSLEVGQGDNVVVPRGTIHRWIPVDTGSGPLRTYIVEATGHVRPPARYLTKYGQFVEGAPLTERAIRGPEGLLRANDSELWSDTEVYVKHGDPTDVRGTVVTYDHHPFDVVGWDGHLYPYAFNYRDFMPVTGKVLQPPSTYQILEGDHFVICNFVPRMLEYHPDALTVPYYHSNVDSDEVMFYYAGETSARKGTGIENGSITLHPTAYVHGPTMRAYLDSVGAAESTEMAFMIDTFRSLRIAEAALGCDQPEYVWTWSGRQGARDASNLGTNGAES
ncbi:homogentisate 1,2-dioxygenase [Rhodococcus pyridinivorans]|uniref:homogentisate 1,2-dioxygenase n=1 Tax=Rhodococcus pyridinivorans TaxID=103816 RepID=UPI001E4CFF0B|nr:homogentisate 1,2-dioxygenase domain-containing protein [Rhodococcus pyridinivorans]MCD5422465.1 homogentisate 1,2-dioxygenase [Rhodococcus pyridinivorans]